MTEYIVAIPSYKRAQLCNDKTLSTLKKMNIPASKIYVYVANKEEEEEYKKIVDKSLYHKLVVGKKGLVPQRQFIMEQWGECKPIVFFDDDIASIDLKMSKFKGKSLDHFFREAFKECKAHKSYIWGVYPVFNPFFRKEREHLTTCLNYIVGAFYGIINRPNLKSIQLTITKENGQKEDVERTIKYFKEDGIVLRFNKVGFVTKYYGKEGGLGTFEARLQPMLEASQKLKKQFPEYGEISTKKNGMTEFRLKKLSSKNEIQNENGEPEKKNKTKRRGGNTRKNKTEKKK
jgi:hypothetical protein